MMRPMLVLGPAAAASPLLAFALPGVQGAPTSGKGTIAAPVLNAAFPNPVRGAALTSFVLPAAGRVDLVLCDVRGRLVRTLTSGDFDAGRHEVNWVARNDAGRALPAGMYFVHMQAGGKSVMRKVLLMP